MGPRKRKPARLRLAAAERVAIPMRGEAAAALADEAPVHPTLVAHVQQDQTQWCWAACGVMILQGLGKAPVPRQCDLANEKFGLTSCCEDGDSEFCNRTCDPDDISAVLQSRGVSLKRTDPVPFSRIRDEIANGRPLELFLASGGAGHVVVVSGCYVASGEMVVVNDPLAEQASDWSYDSLSGLGWKLTWVA